MINKIEENAYRLQGLLQHFSLLYQGITQDQLSVHMSRFDLSELLQSIFAEKIIVSSPPYLPKIEGDWSHLWCTFESLVPNYVVDSPVYVNVSLSPNQNQVTIEIQYENEFYRFDPLTKYYIEKVMAYHQGQVQFGEEDRAEVVLTLPVSQGGDNQTG